MERKKSNENYFLPLEMTTYCYICNTKNGGVAQMVRAQDS
jgi:hypothetical protein